MVMANFCSDCGTQLQNGSSYCSNCGVQAKVEKYQAPMRITFSETAEIKSKRISPHTVRFLMKFIFFTFLFLGAWAGLTWYEVFNSNCVGVKVNFNTMLNSDGWVTCYKTDSEFLFHKLLEQYVYTASAFKTVLMGIFGLSIGIVSQSYSQMKEK
jgi:RNA polymerase subunit RPABC4/transcription elongation factor Spt4